VLFGKNNIKIKNMKKSEIKIEYNGKYPCLCSGILKVWIGDKMYEFDQYALSSGGYIAGDIDDMYAVKGDWSIVDWPKDFPEEYKEAVLEKVNKEIPHGCCGGCI
jgi:hypothetical protein